MGGAKDKLGKGREAVFKKEIEVMDPKVGSRLGRKWLNGENRNEKYQGCRNLNMDKEQMLWEKPVRAIERWEG